MGQITQIILLMSFQDGDPDNGDQSAMIEFNKALIELQNLTNPPFVRVDDYAGGSKNFCISIYMAAFNYLDIYDFYQLILKTKWRDAESFQILIMDEEDEAFRLLNWSDIPKEMNRFN